MDTEEFREAVSKDFFTEAQESIVEEIGIVMADMVEKNFDKAHLRLRNLKDELVTDIKISKEKELR